MPIVYCLPLVANICVLDMTRCCRSIRRNHNQDKIFAMTVPEPERVQEFQSQASNNGFSLSLSHYSRFCYKNQALSVSCVNTAHFLNK